MRLEAAEDLAWRTILRLYADYGRPPAPADMVTASGIAAEDLAGMLQSLQSHDLIDLDPQTGDIRLAYPFTQAATGHRVKLGGHVLHALCAIDALGVAGMYGTDIAISSPCHHCGSQVNVETASNGKSLRSVAPSEAAVFVTLRAHTSGSRRERRCGPA